MAAEVDTLNRRVDYTYDAVQNLISMTAQDGGVTAYAYDNLDRLIGITDPNGNVTAYTPTTSWAGCLRSETGPQDDDPKSRPISRRSAMKASRGMVAASLFSGTIPRACGFESANARPWIGVIGCGIRWNKRVFVRDGRYGLGKQFP